MRVRRGWVVWLSVPLGGVLRVVRMSRARSRRRRGGATQVVRAVYRARDVVQPGRLNRRRESSTASHIARRSLHDPLAPQIRVGSSRHTTPDDGRTAPRPRCRTDRRTSGRPIVLEQERSLCEIPRPSLLLSGRSGSVLVLPLSGHGGHHHRSQRLIVRIRRSQARCRRSRRRGGKRSLRRPSAVRRVMSREAWYVDYGSQTNVLSASHSPALILPDP